MPLKLTKYKSANKPDNKILPYPNHYITYIQDKQKLIF